MVTNSDRLRRLDSIYSTHQLRQLPRKEREDHLDRERASERAAGATGAQEHVAPQVQGLQIMYINTRNHVEPNNELMYHSLN